MALPWWQGWASWNIRQVVGARTVEWTRDPVSGQPVCILDGWYRFEYREPNHDLHDGSHAPPLEVIEHLRRFRRARPVHALPPPIISPR